MRFSLYSINTTLLLKHNVSNLSTVRQLYTMFYTKRKQNVVNTFIDTQKVAYTTASRSQLMHNIYQNKYYGIY